MPGVAALAAAKTTTVAAASATNSFLKPPPPLASPSAASNHLRNPVPFLAPVAVAAFTLNRYRDVLAEKYNKFVEAQRPSSISSHGPHQLLHAYSSKEKPFSKLFATSNSLFGERGGVLKGIPKLPTRRSAFKPPKALRNEVFGFRYPVLEVKPEWFWRTLACIPYLFALQISDTASYMQPLMDKLDGFPNLAWFIPGAYTRVPQWFIIVYFCVVYFKLVRNRSVPHFLRFHLVMGLLLENLVQAFWVVSNMFPLIHYNGLLGPYYWAGVGVTYILILLHCIRHALAGSYVNVPVVSDAAYIHTIFNIGGYIGQ
ncbi:hypothetical protein Tsubulata_037078 [Turnera subulata]|uniref:Protein TIC 20 n=1 Tax=Turnera subulata TaxID=218843 RepID=A0A9Q0JPD8_9ROSI|nr:hypothetical protein Tsubulata_037078 [Turnera subulata]